MADDEEQLAAEVVKFPVLYDKSHREFHRKDVKSNAWTQVAKELGLEDGNEAEKAFGKLRERYTRFRRQLKKKTKSGTKASIVDNAKKRLESLQFLSWLDKYTKPRKSKTNLKCTFSEEEEEEAKEEEEGEEEEEESDSDNTEERAIIKTRGLKENDFDSLMLPEPVIQSSIASTSHDPLDSNPDPDSSCGYIGDVSNTFAEKTVNKGKKRKLNSATSAKGATGKDKTEKNKEDVEMEILKSLSKSLEKPEEADSFNNFGIVVAEKLRSLARICGDEIEDVEFEILALIQRKRTPAKQALLYSLQKFPMDEQNKQYKNL